MDCWIELGIEEGSDKKKIKSSFLKLKKIINNDSDPDGFADLKKAYKEALSIVEEKGAFANSYHEESPKLLNSTSLPSLEKRVAEKLASDDDNIIIKPKNDYDSSYKLPHKKKYFLRRFFAFSIDFIILIFILNIRTSGESILPTLGYMLIYLFLVIPLMEASPLEGSIGKLLTGIKVTNYNDKQLGIFQSFKRTFSTTFVIALIKFRVWGLFARLINNEDLPQDISSRSRVVLRSFKKSQN